jgi:glycosyltransferase involved in cell wall biosynthesis
VISVLLPFRDAAGTLDAAARSVLADLGADDELVLVDDGSTDGGSALAASLAGEDGRVALVASGGVGVAGALRRGLATCRGAWIGRMDADDVSLPGRLPAERALLEADAALGAVATKVALIGEPGPGIRRYVAWQNALVTAEEHARSIFVEAPVCHPSTMIRRAALDAVGGFRDGPFAEDYDLWLRLIAAGWGIAKVPEVLFEWRIHTSNTTFTDARLSFDALRRLRAEYLARRIDRPFGIWGAGPAGKRLARELERRRALPSFFIDIDPKKIGRRARGVPILGVEDGIARVRRDAALLVVAVATLGARDLVRERLSAEDLVETKDFVCAA